MGLIRDYDIEILRDSDRDLPTYFAICICTRRRARPDDRVPDPTDRGGWWADFLADVPGDEIGSRLWTLQGLGMPDALALAPDMVKEATMCAMEDGLVSAVQVQVEAVGPGVMAVSVVPTLPDGKMGDVLGPWYISV